MEKTVSYNTKNTYVTLNTLTHETKNVWVVFHGIGYLSRYFIKHFERLNTNQNYIIAPQAPSKYYLKNEYKYVGASWLTKENTLMETENVLNYIDAVFNAEQIPPEVNLIVFGFSQGVSIATRWVTKRKIQCESLILYAGGIPNELTKEDFEYLNWNATTVKIVYGEKDDYLNEERLKQEKVKIDKLFQGNAKLIRFEGGHEMNTEVIKNLV
ncbi:esterase [Flagellimonas sp. 389]|uniref:alpha/beta hydrolase n=1 Tax=Flagellimonas sp. 389 TaxID=2835862 RepID=UPI001BD53969|nr:esterase [Flagellimonas sp. 389]MBS9462113.1 esterase [Flagellimonas sp. 389]